MILLKKKRLYILLHIFIWVFLSMLPLLSSGNSQARNSEFISRWYLNVFFNAGIFYFYYCYVNRKFLSGNGLTRYFIYSIVIIGIYSILRGLISDFFFSEFYSLRKMPLSNLIFTSFFLDFLFIGMAVFLNFAENWFITQQLQQRIEKEKLESELKMLRQQLNPHFLFNTLNNIHTLVYKKSDKASDAILKLSGLMRYMLYESEDEVVSLSKEVDYLVNFVELQRLRLSYPDTVSFKVSGETEGKSIAPLLLLPFVENAFKYAPGTIDSFINIGIKIFDEAIVFTCINKYRTDISKLENGGIGLKNVRKRLKLQYPDCHLLSINKTDNTFEVNLTLFNKIAKDEYKMYSS